MLVPRSLLNRTITVEPYEGSSAYGPVYGEPVEMRARVEGRRRTVRRPDGVDVISQASATIRPGTPVPAESRVTIDGQAYWVLDVVQGEGLTGPAYVELVLGVGGPR